MSQKTNIQKMLSSLEAKYDATKKLTSSLNEIRQQLTLAGVEDPCEVIHEIVEAWEDDQTAE